MLRVFGIGSPHGDDQVGWMLVQELLDEGRPDLRACVVRTPIEILDRFDPDDSVIVVDACDAGEEPGAVVVREWPDALPARAGTSSHGLGVAEVLRLAESLGRRPRSVTLFGVQIGRLGPGSSPGVEVRSRWPEIVASLHRALDERTTGG